MKFQKTEFIRGGLTELSNAICEMEKKDWFVNAILLEDGDHLVVYYKKDLNLPFSEQKVEIIEGGISTLDSIFSRMTKSGWLVSAITSENNSYLVVYQKLKVLPNALRNNLYTANPELFDLMSKSPAQ